MNSGVSRQTPDSDKSSQTHRETDTDRHKTTRAMAVKESLSNYGGACASLYTHSIFIALPLRTARGQMLPHFAFKLNHFKASSDKITNKSLRNFLLFIQNVGQQRIAFLSHFEMRSIVVAAAAASRNTNTHTHRYAYVFA